MIADVREHLEARPFRPFFILTSGGKRYRVPTADHAGINPQGNRVLIWFDNGAGLTIAALHIVAIEEEATSNA